MVAGGASREPRDSRRLTGPNLLWDRPGAVMEVDVPDGAPGETLLARWREHARGLLDAVGLGTEDVTVRRFPGGASVGFPAPIDALYTATDINEAAWQLAWDADAHGAPAAHTASRADDAHAVSADARPTRADLVARLAAQLAAERNPALLDMQRAAAAHGVTLLADDEHVSVGLGRGARVFAAGALPAPDDVDWARVHDVPVALVTGTNGKTTTVRCLAAILRAAGGTPGFTSTDAVQIGEEIVERGDWSGPGGARRVLRDARVDGAVLETARGGMLRRGLALSGARAAAITNIAADHEGEYGIFGTDGMAAAKLVVLRGLHPAGCAVLNADDPVSVRAAARVTVPVLWFGLDASASPLREHVAAGGRAAYLDGDALCLVREGRRRLRVPVASVPMTFGGAARHNVSNALAAMGLADVLDVPPDAIARGLQRFDGDVGDNPGRLNRFVLGGVTVLVDFAHNPHGVAALADTARNLPASRRLVLLGQAGDRDDDAITALVDAALALAPDHVVIKEMPADLRGRAPGEVPALIARTLARRGLRATAVEHAPTELDGVRQALAWARPGDLLVLLSHAQRGDVLALLERLAADDWAPGRPVDAAPVAPPDGA